MQSYYIITCTTIDNIFLQILNYVQPFVPNAVVSSEKQKETNEWDFRGKRTWQWLYKYKSDASLSTNENQMKLVRSFNFGP